MAVNVRRQMAADKEQKLVEKCKAQLRSAQLDDVAMKFRKATTKIELGHFENLRMGLIDEMQKIELDRRDAKGRSEIPYRK